MTVIAEAAGSFVMSCAAGQRRRCQDRRDCRDASWLRLSSPGLGSTRRSVAIDVCLARRVARDVMVVEEVAAVLRQHRDLIAGTGGNLFRCRGVDVCQRLSAKSNLRNRHWS